MFMKSKLQQKIKKFFKIVILSINTFIFYKIINQLNFMKIRNFFVGGIIAGASAIGTFAGFHMNRADAVDGIKTDKTDKHVLIASIGYMGGKPSFFRRFGYNGTNTVFLSFDSKNSCETARLNFQDNYRDEMFNSVCITMPRDGDIMFTEKGDSSALAW